MLDDRDRCLRELANQLERGVGIGQVVVAQLPALDLLCGADPVRPVGHVEGGLLVRVLAVAQPLPACRGDGQLLGQRLAQLRRQPACDRGIVGRRARKGFGRQLLAQPGRDRALGLQRGKHRLVVIRRDHHGDARVVLGGGADHRRPADVDHLDRFVMAGAGRDRGLERIEVDHHQIDRRDAECRDRGHVRIEVAACQDAAVHRGMQGFDPTVENAGRAGHRSDVDHREARLAQRARGAAGRDQRDLLVGEPARELDQTRLVPDRQQRTADRCLAHRM